MSLYDSWLLEGSEPDAWDEDSAPHGVCEWDENALEADDAGVFCPTCSPRELLASFRVVDGVVVETAL